MTYVRIGDRSWHIQREGSRMLCGKRASAHRDPSNPLDHQASGWRPETDPPPMDERTCEVCLRVYAAQPKAWQAQVTVPPSP